MQEIAEKISEIIDFANRDENYKIKFYNSLKRSKNYAINKIFYSKIHANLPIERQDLESIAWFAFEESLLKYLNNKRFKKFETFFIDNVYWRCKDYCEKFDNNRHKILNYANNDYFYQDYAKLSSSPEKDWIKTIALQQYYDILEDGTKKLILTLLLEDNNLAQITRKLSSTKTIVSKSINLLANDLKEIV